MTPDIDLRERAELCDLFDALGPDAPTLCGDWTTADLAAHLVVRERDPVALPGILLGGRFEGLAEKAMARELEGRGYEAVVERVRRGPPPGPTALRPVGRLTNTIEFVVHHEDVRRPAGQGPRPDDAALQDAVWDLLGRGGRLLAARARLGGAGLTLVRPGSEPVVAHRAGDLGTATLTGDPVEVLLHLYGRPQVAEAELGGDPAAVARVGGASFGI
ncbi:TIGR03085 family metal-binding protein [Iamia majanohamensis]|uniref:TIGR03085 family metal-binding protein n=1 Tax=Iamia majanohamensis TaxID=467976 RepID=A0AAE9YBN9_9ACTN|nr:TIGR03085 family metal-binding protein [Iamia majanohamensis]WCO65066.1 TIGR03085 family metal-binding protein [Iamia majanohamensis]